MKRRGSALLIVLGVLSFLVVSAVAFSAFMRRSRLPSSYLRRVVSSRQLAKGALARAVDEIDRAIAEGVHPGIGGTTANTWRDRIFFRGGGEQGIAHTAPTLTFEGLAYIPPPLVNEARYWSRKTPTAVWQSFGYDTGRFAYCAIDVSDFFDVNRLVADYPRSSAANRRVTAAHLFEDSSHRSAPSGAEAWDTFMEQFRDIDKDTLEIRFDSSSKMPLVSLADFNLALGQKGSIGLMKSPFAEYVKNEPGSFYPADGGAELDAYGRMTFVTDGWFPQIARTRTDSSGNVTTVETYDLSDARYQPFDMEILKKDAPPLLSEALTNQGSEWFRYLGGFGMAAIADYLDADSVPISLAVPTTERVPMICGVEPKLSGDPAFKVERTVGDLKGRDGAQLVPDNSQATEREVEQEVRWNIDGESFAKGFMGGRVRALLAYPFLHPEDNDSKDWTVDGRLVMFLSSDSRMPFRTRNMEDVLHLTSDTLTDTGLNRETGLINTKLESEQPKFAAKVENEEDALKVIELRLDSGMRLGSDLTMDGNELLRATFQWKQTRQKDGNGGFTPWSPAVDAVIDKPSIAENLAIKADTSIPALYGTGNKIGQRDEAFTADKLSASLTATPGQGKKVFLNAAVWLRVKNADGKIVDMVPASICDDAVQNGANDPMTESFVTLAMNGAKGIDGAPWPLLKFKMNVEFEFSIEGMKTLETTPQEMAFEQSVLMVPDPRHNHAPENWFVPKGGTLSAEEWLKQCLVGGANRDGDIFMATSDAEYLQSIYELAFIPRFKDLREDANKSNNKLTGGSYNIPSGNDWNEGMYVDDASKTLNAGFMWATYDPISHDRLAFDELPFTSEGTGMKVNPYSDSTNVLMAAFANTPIDWRRASTNAMDDAKDYADMSVKDFNAKYAWNEYSSGGKFAWRDLKKVAGEMMLRVRAAGNWKTAWNEIDWYSLCEDGKVFPGLDMEGDTDELWDVDRKFLYGFWRDCFAAKQQLFIIFVRAEPLMLGGGTADQLPPQLGARAVAVVWRDPSPGSGYPHRTRVLFYRPLD